MSTSSNGRPPIDIRNLKPISGDKVAHIMANGFNSNGTVNSSQIPSQSAINNTLNSIPNGESRDKLKINGVSDDDCQRLERFSITFSAINDGHNDMIQSSKSQIANLVASRIKNTESVEEKTVDMLAKEKTFYFQDLLIADNEKQSRVDLLTNKLSKCMRKKPKLEIKRVINLLVYYDIRLNSIDLAAKERKYGVQNEYFKVMWKLTYGEDIDSHQTRSKTTVLQHLGNLYGVTSIQREARTDENNDNFIVFKKKWDSSTKYDETKGNAFIHFGNSKIKKVIEDLHNYGFKSEAKTSVKRSKKRQSRAYDNNNNKDNVNKYNDNNNNNKSNNNNNNNNNNTYNDDNNNNNNNNNKYNHNNNNDMDHTFDYSARISTDSNKKRRIDEERPLSSNPYSINDIPSTFSPSYYNSIPTELKNFEGREIWSIKHQPNCVGFWCGQSFIVAIFMGLPAKKLTISFDLNISEPRCVADIFYEPRDLTIADIEELTSAEFMANNAGIHNIFILPKRKKFAVILPIPGEFRNALCAPNTEIKLKSGLITLTFKCVSSKLMYIKNSLNSSLKFKSKNITNELENNLKKTSFSDYFDRKQIIKAIDDQISPRQEWFYYRQVFEKTTKVPSNLKSQNDVIQFWTKQYHESCQVKQVTVKQIMDREEATKQNMNHKPSILNVHGIDEDTFYDLIEEQEINDKRIEIIENELEVTDWITIDTFDCMVCNAKIKDIEWNEMKNRFCMKCIKKEYKRKENKSLSDVGEEQIHRGVEVIAYFPKTDDEDEHWDVGSIYVKYASRSNENKDDHIVGILFCNSKTPTIYYYNDPKYQNALKNTKIISKY